MEQKKYDAVVVGAGVAGLGVAIGLAQQKYKVLVVSMPRKGESTPAAGGILDPVLEMTPGHPLFALSRRAFQEYPSWIKYLEKKTGGQSHYLKTGMLFAAFNPREMKDLKRRYHWQHRAGIPVQLLTRDQVLEREPEVTPKIFGGLFYPTVARIHPGKLRELMRLYAKKSGVYFTEVTQNPCLILGKGKVSGLRIGKRIIESPKVVNATGSWAGCPAPFVKKLPVVPVRGQILLLKGRLKTQTILHTLEGGYIVPWSEKLTGPAQEYLIGSTVEHAGFHPDVTSAGRKDIFKKNLRLVPRLKALKEIDCWAGLRPRSTKGIPFIGPSKLKGFFLAAGYYRSGILIGALAGKLLAQGIAKGSMPKLLRPFDPRKFNL